jgi:putative phosphoesterase
MGRARAAARVTSWVQHERTLAIHDGKLRLACVADTHSKPHPNAEPVLRALGPDAILHGGDIGDLAVLEGLAAIAPVLAVRGNIDERANDLPDGITLHLKSGDDTALTMLLAHIVVAGPRVRTEAAQLAHEVGARVIVCGHSHVPFIGRDKGLTVFNPGSIGPRRLRLPIVFGVLEIADGKLSLRHIDCETGQEWSP